MGLGFGLAARSNAAELAPALEKQITQGEGRLFTNQKVGDVQPAKLTPAYQIKAAKLSGVFNYVVMRFGRLRLGEADIPGYRNGHADLASGQPVRAAGQAIFENGKLKAFTDGSGHYNKGISRSDAAMQASEAIDAFAEEGFNAEGLFGSVTPE